MLKILPSVAIYRGWISSAGITRTTTTTEAAKVLDTSASSVVFFPIKWHRPVVCRRRHRDHRSQSGQQRRHFNRHNKISNVYSD